MVTEFITPYNSVFNVPEMYLSNIPTQEQLDSITSDDIILLGINSRLESNYSIEFCAILVSECIDGVIKGKVLNSMKYTVSHGIKRGSKITLYEDHVFAVLSEDQYVELFE